MFFVISLTRFLQLDETDTKNESYICFRRREIKAVRKTRAQQLTYSDKMLRLQAELTMSIDLAKCVLQREQLKREASVQGQAVWERRLALVELKRKFPSLGTKEDEELFFDKERIAKKPKIEPPRYDCIQCVCLYLLMLGHVQPDSHQVTDRERSRFSITSCSC